MKTMMMMTPGVCSISMVSTCKVSIRLGARRLQRHVGIGDLVSCPKTTNVR